MKVATPAPKISPLGVFFRILGVFFRLIFSGLTAWYRDGSTRMEGERVTRWDARDRIERYWSVGFYSLLLWAAAANEFHLAFIEDATWSRIASIAALTFLALFVALIAARRIVVAVTKDAWEFHEMVTDSAHLSIIGFTLIGVPFMLSIDPVGEAQRASVTLIVVVFPLLSGIASGIWASSTILVDHREKRLLLSKVKVALGGLDSEWAHSRWKKSIRTTRVEVPGKKTRSKAYVALTIRHAPAAAFTNIRGSQAQAKLGTVAPEWQIDERATDVRRSELVLVRATDETRASREIAQESGDLVTAASVLVKDEHGNPTTVRYTLEPGTPASAFPRVDALAKSKGLRVVEWEFAAGYAIAKRLPADVARARYVIAEGLSCHPYEVEIEVTRSGDGSFATVDVVRAPLFALDAEKRAEKWTLITRMIPFGTTGWIVEEQGSTVMLTWGPTREVPDLVTGAALLPQEITPDDWARIPLGIDSTGAVAALDLQAGPHSLIIGPTGSGKSVSTRLLILGALARGFEVVYIDPVKRGAGLRDMEPWTRGMFTTSAAEAAEVLTAVYAEVTQRVDMIEDARVEDWRSLPGVKPVLVILDEFTGLVRPDAKPSNRNSDAYAEWEAKAEAQATITTLVSKIAAEARSAGYFLALATQRPDVTYIPGEARSNLGSVVVLVSPKKAPRRQTLDMVFDGDEVDDAKVEVADLHGSKPGFALVANEGGGLRGIRVGYIAPEEPARILESLGVPLCDLIVPKHERKRGSAAAEPEPDLWQNQWGDEVEEPLPTPVVYELPDEGDAFAEPIVFELPDESEFAN